jgi:protein transport protein SEC24
MGTIDADKTITVTFEHSRSLDERQGASIQCAVLYTTPAGRRRVRVLNLNLPVVTLAASVFRFADMDAVVSYLLREGSENYNNLLFVLP